MAPPRRHGRTSALALAARGIEGLVRNNGRMRLVVGCTLDLPEIDAIEEGATPEVRPTFDAIAATIVVGTAALPALRDLHL